MELDIRRVPDKLLVKFINEQVTRRSIKYVYSMSEGSLAYAQDNMGINPERTIFDRFLSPLDRGEIISEKRKVARGKTSAR
jgi:hypothetical protein